MLRQRSDQAFLLLLALIDAVVASLAWIVAYVIRVDTGWIPLFSEDAPSWWWCIRSIPIAAGAVVGSFYFCGMYQLRRRWSLKQELTKVLQANALALLVILAVTFYSRNPYESRLATVLFFGLTFVGVVAVRRSFGLYFRWCRKLGKVRRRAVVVGTGRTARRVADAVARNNWLGIHPVGFVEDGEISAMQRTKTLGTIDDLPRLVEELQLDYVFVALPFRRFAETKRVFRLLSNSLAEVRLAPDVPHLTSMRVHIDQLEGLPILNLQMAPHSVIGLALKRGMDIGGAAFGLIVLSPLFLAIALAIKLHSPGPVFYFQERMGLNGRRFRMVKFRTMRVGAESTSGPVWAKPGDDRRTRLGAFLRETSLDEFPQLWNVLWGEMSLVGPRPERPFFIQKFRDSIPKYMLRHTVKAGMTGWAQVNGWRGDTSLRKRVQYDLYYIVNWSVWLDLRIILMTFFRGLRDRNAY